MFLLSLEGTAGVSIFAGFLSGCLCAGYGYMINRAYWINKGLGIVRVFAMVFDAITAVLAGLTALSVVCKHKNIHQSPFGTFAFVSSLLDLLWFSLQCKFYFQSLCASDDDSYCERKKLAVGFSVFIFIGVILRGYATLSTFAYNVKRNTPALPVTLPAATAAAATSTTALTRNAQQSLAKPTSVRTRALSTLQRLGSVRYGEDFGMEIKRTLLKGDSESEDEIDRLDRLEEEVDVASESETEADVGSGNRSHLYSAVDRH